MSAEWALVIFTIAVQLVGAGVMVGITRTTLKGHALKFADQDGRFLRIEQKVDGHGERISALEARRDL